MVRKALALLLLWAPVRAQAPAGPPPALVAELACRKAWTPEFQKTYPLVTQDYWNEKCAAGMTPKEILLEARKIYPLEGGESDPAKLAELEKQAAKFKSIEAGVQGAQQTLDAGDPARLYGEKGGGPGAVPGAIKAPQGVPLNAPAGGPPKAPARAEPPAPARTGLPAIVPYRKALNAYIDMTGLQNYTGEIGVKNEGLERFNQGLAKDPEFAKKLVAFYARVDARDRAYHKKPGAPLGKPTLDLAAGAGDNKDLPAGWAWTDALAVAGGDANEAMRLIGWCGHDDVNRAGLDRARADGPARKLMADEAARLDRQIAEARETAAKAAAMRRDDPDCLLCLINDPAAVKTRLDALRAPLAGLKLADFKTEHFFDCPTSASPFYLPRSLDAKADITDKLKARIAAAQGKKPENIPAKYYHVMGAAAAACELIRNGAPGWLAESVEVNSAWVYRTMRMKQDAAAYAVQRREIAAAYAERLRTLKPGEARPGLEAFRDELNEDRAVAGKRISFSHMDAFELMELWGYGGRVFGKDIPPLDFRIGWLKGTFFKRKPGGWSEKRFAAAKSRMETFFVDWEWTEAEHEAGSEFARKTCKKAP